MPCGPGAPKIYVDEPEEFNSLWENSLKCAERGLCFTEVSESPAGVVLGPCPQYFSMFRYVSEGFKLDTLAGSYTYLHVPGVHFTFCALAILFAYCLRYSFIVCY